MSTTTAPSPTTPGITGYRNLTQREKDLMNKIKAKGEEIRELIEEVHAFHMEEMAAAQRAQVVSDLPDVVRKEANRLCSEGGHWRRRAADDIQDGLMKLNRAVARPTTFA